MGLKPTPPTSCVNSITDSLEWPPLQQRHRKARLEVFFKFHHSLISISSSYQPRPTSSGRSSRKDNDYSYDTPSCRTHYRPMSFFPRTLPDWNSLPQEVVAADTMDCFKSRLHSHLKQWPSLPFPTSPSPCVSPQLTAETISTSPTPPLFWFVFGLVDKHPQCAL